MRDSLGVRLSTPVRSGVRGRAPPPDGRRAGARPRGRWGRARARAQRL